MSIRSLTCVALALSACSLPPAPPPRAPGDAAELQPVSFATDCLVACITRASGGVVPKWSRLELDLRTTRNVSNPFDPSQIDLSVVFVSPDDGTIRIPAFFDGEGWKARFTPVNEGGWRARTALNGSPVGNTIVFTVTSPLKSSHGFVRVDKRNPYHLAFDDGTPFFAVGINIGWWKDDPIKDYERWINALADNGGNTIRIWMAPWSFALEWNDTPLGDYAGRMQRAAWLDRVFEMAEARGITIQLVLLNHGQFSETTNAQWHENPFNKAVRGGFLGKPIEFATNARAKALFKRRLRYIAARWGYSPNLLAWEWWNEVNFTPIVETKLHKAWVEEMTPALMQHDPNDHLLTTSYSIEGDAEIWNMPEIDLVQRHEYNASDPKWFKPIASTQGGVGRYEQQRKLLPKPLVMAEWGASPEREEPNASSRYGVALHNGLWAAPFAGMVSTAMYWWWDWLVEPANLWPHFKGVASFMRDEDLALMRPVPAKSDTFGATAMALGNETRVLLWLRNVSYNHDDARFKYQIAMSTGEADEETFRFEPKTLATVTVTVSGLADGDYRVTWFDTITGRSVASSRAVAKSGTAIVAAPAFNRDLAAKITRP